MGTGYTRKDTANNIDDGNVINAADLDLEFDGIQSAFDNSTGHTHDGTAGEGAPIETIGPAQDIVSTASALRPKTDNTVDLGTTALEYKDLFLDGTAHIDTLDVDENASITGTLSVTSTSTFSDDVTFTGANYNVVWDKSDNALEFTDSAKATFGNGGDLQIYHNGSNSFIADSGTGNLLLRGNNVSIQNAAGTETVAQFVEDSFVKLFHDNSQKFATTSAGISVTDDIDVANNIIMSSDAANISFGADSEIYIKHSHDVGLILENTNTTDGQNFVLNLKSNEDTITDGEQIGRINFSTNSSAGGVSVGTQASIRVDATGTYSSTVAGSTMEFWTTQTDGTLSRAMYLDDDQSVHFTGPSSNVKLDATNSTLDFPDNFKIMIGGGDDLQLHHDGTNSYIVNDTGDFTIRNTADDKDVIIQSDNGSGGLTSYVVADGSTGQTKLYHYGSLKFNTTSDGAYLTGNTFQVVGTAAGTKIQIQTTDSGASDGPILELYRNSSSPAADDDIGRIDFVGEDSAGASEVYGRIEMYIEDPTASTSQARMELKIQNGADSLAQFLTLRSDTSVPRVIVNEGQADIDFVVEGDGDTTLIYADASTDRVGIGTNSPTVKLHVNAGNDNTVARFESTDTEAVIELVDTTGRAQIRSRNDLRFYVAGDTVRAMDITSAGNVGIGTASPDTIVEIVGADPILTIRDSETSSASAQATLRLAESGASDTLNNYYDITADGGVFKIIDAWNEGAGSGPDTRLAIIDNGNVGLGTESPAVPLEIKHQTAIIRLTDSNNGSGGTSYKPHIEFYAIDDKVGTIGFSDSKDLTIKTEDYNSANIQLVTQGRVDIETGGGSDPTTAPAPTLRLVNTTGASDWDTDDVNGAIEWYTNDTSGNAPQVNAFIKSVGGNDNGTLPSGELAFGTVTYNALEAVERIRISSQGHLGINTSQPVASLHINDIGTTGPAIFIENASGTEGDITVIDGEVLQIGHWNTTSATFTERARVDSSGHLLVGRTSVGTTGAGHVLRAGDSPIFSRVGSSNNSECMIVNKDNEEGVIIQLRQAGTTRVHLGVCNDSPGDPFWGNSGNVGLRLEQTGADRIDPCFGDDGDIRDNAIDLGGASTRFDDIYATNNAIQTSDEREKQQIASLTTSEIAAAKAISKLFKTFKWNESVEAKGDAARTHSGVIAQQVESAMTAEGLDAGDYAFFTSTTWWETVTDVAAQDAVIEDGITVHEAKPARKSVMVYATADEAPEGATERNRKGIRYGELMSFIHAATEQRLASIESRLDALESA